MRKLPGGRHLIMILQLTRGSVTCCDIGRHCAGKGWTMDGLPGGDRFQGPIARSIAPPCMLTSAILTPLRTSAILTPLLTSAILSPLLTSAILYLFHHPCNTLDRLYV